MDIGVSLRLVTVILFFGSFVWVGRVGKFGGLVAGGIVVVWVGGVVGVAGGYIVIIFYRVFFFVVKVVILRSFIIFRILGLRFMRSSFFVIFASFSGFGRTIIW